MARWPTGREAMAGGGSARYERQWVLSVPYPLRFLFASRLSLMGQMTTQ